MLPILAITMGDPAGIGPEIVVRALSDKETYSKCRPLVTGDAGVIRRAIHILNLPMIVHTIERVGDARFEYGCIDVLDLQCIDPDAFEFGKVSAQCGNAAFLSITKAIELAMANKVDGTVTAPLNKEALNLAGHHFDGHTEIYAHFTGTKKYAMLLADEFLRVIHVSTHVSLREACDRVKKARIVLLMVDAAGLDERDVAAQIAGLALRPDQRLCVIINKIDKTDNYQLSIINYQLIALSAKTGENLDALREWLSAAVDTSTLDAGSAVVSSARHYEALTRAREAVGRVSEGLSSGMSSDLLAEDIREVLHHLGTITGEITTDEILGTIFSKFCIGK